mmetsp:Transcript_131830/g.253695  ORF Transcript_131830/g.253695 Transcript_131830/m.253695 type:complete len:211 (+) Transcript_131830:54-686(+)
MLPMRLRVVPTDFQWRAERHSVKRRVWACHLVTGQHCKRSIRRHIRGILRKRIRCSVLTRSWVCPRILRSISISNLPGQTHCRSEVERRRTRGDPLHRGGAPMLHPGHAHHRVHSLLRTLSHPGVQRVQHLRRPGHKGLTYQLEDAAESLRIEQEALAGRVAGAAARAGQGSERTAREMSSPRRGRNGPWRLQTLLSLEAFRQRHQACHL